MNFIKEFFQELRYIFARKPMEGGINCKKHGSQTAIVLFSKVKGSEPWKIEVCYRCYAEKVTEGLEKF